MRVVVLLDASNTGIRDSESNDGFRLLPNLDDKSAVKTQWWWVAPILNAAIE
jgi:hypothetical protein